MSQDVPQDHISRKRVVYTLPGLEAVTVRQDVEYRMTDAGALTMDLYYPPDAKPGAALPAVIVVAGYSDARVPPVPGFPRFKNMGWVVSWAQLMAATGMVAITYTNREPTADLDALIQHVQKNAAALSVNEQKIGLFAGSGNVPLALSVLMQEPARGLTCAGLCYAFMLDLEGSTTVSEAAATYGFVNPSAGKSVDDLSATPLFIVRASQDHFPHLNDMIDAFLLKALARNLPLTFVNHLGPHGFDLLQDSDASRETIRQVLAFLRFHLLG